MTPVTTVREVNPILARELPPRMAAAATPATPLAAHTLPSRATQNLVTASSSATNPLAAGLQVRKVERSSSPDPAPVENALFSFGVTGLQVADDGDIFGRGELFVATDGVRRTGIHEANDDELVTIANPKPFFLPPSAIDIDGSSVALALRILDEDPGRVEELASLSGRFTLESLFDGSADTADVVLGDAENFIRVRLSRRPIRQQDVSPAYIDARDGDWARITRDFAAEMQEIQRSKYRLEERMPRAGYYQASSIFEAYDMSRFFVSLVLDAKAAILSVDRDLPQRAALVQEYNRQVMLLRRLSIRVVDPDCRRPLDGQLGDSISWSRPGWDGLNVDLRRPGDPRDPRYPRRPCIPGRSVYPFADLESFLIHA